MHGQESFICYKLLYDINTDSQWDFHMIIYAYKTTKRVRPLSKKEINEGAEKCVVAVEKTIAARDTQFTYDYVFPSNVEQIEG